MPVQAVVEPAGTQPGPPDDPPGPRGRLGPAPLLAGQPEPHRPGTGHPGAGRQALAWHQAPPTRPLRRLPAGRLSPLAPGGGGVTGVRPVGLAPTQNAPLRGLAPVSIAVSLACSLRALRVRTGPPSQPIAPTAGAASATSPTSQRPLAAARRSPPTASRWPA